MRIFLEHKNVKDEAGKGFVGLMYKPEGQPLLLLLSGGSSLDLLGYVPTEVFTHDMTIGMLDDRYAKDASVNSFSLMRTTPFYSDAINAGATFLDSSVRGDETLEQYADRYEGCIREWLAKNPNGIIRATVGIGPDGHTSGILPHPEDPENFERLFNGERLMVGYDVGNKNPHRYRMTSTFTLLRKCEKVVTYMAGQAKKAALAKVVAEEGSLAETPGRIIRELPDVVVYTDIAV